MERFQTVDGFHVEVFLFNPWSYSAHVFVANKPNEFVNSANNTVYSLHGRDSYECLLSDGHNMNRAELVRMFFSDRKNA